MLLGGGVLLLIASVLVGKIVLPAIKNQGIPASLNKPFDLKSIKKRKADAVAASSVILPDASTVTEHLQNSDFEGAFEPAPPPIASQYAKITGHIAANWLDLSQFAIATVDYSQDKTFPEQGKSSQRIDIPALTTGEVIFAQPVRLTKGRTYRWTVWLRSSEPDTLVTASIRMRGSPYKYYGVTQAHVGLAWQQVQVTGKVTDSLYAYNFVLLEMKQPGVTIWVDAAHIQPVG